MNRAAVGLDNDSHVPTWDLPAFSADLTEFLRMVNTVRFQGRGCNNE